MNLNIIGLSQQHSGCGYHRVLLPLGFMQDIKGFVCNIIPKEKMDGVDIVLYNRVCSYDNNWEAFRELMNNPKIVMDIDDDWVLPPNHLLYDQYPELAPRIENNLRTADLVTVTNELLASKVRPFNKNVEVIPNGIPFGRNQFTDDRRTGERVSIFWAGSVTHEHDIKILKYPLQRLQGQKDKIIMTMAGWNDSNAISEHIWRKMFSSFTAGCTLPYRKIHAMEPVNYMAAYEHADIMVIPLESSEWHGCKSNLKILEAASKRIPCIVSNVKPYNNDTDAPVLWVNSQQDWFKHLNFLINDKAARLELGEKLYTWANEKYNLEQINIKRRSIFAGLCQAQTHLGLFQQHGGDGELSPAHSAGIVRGLSEVA